MKRVLFASIALAFGANAMAQTCASPIQIFSDTPFNGDSCTADNTITGFGPLPSPHNDVVYSFVAQGANATLTMNAAAGYDYAVLLIDACSAIAPAPLNGSTGPANGGNFQLSGLTDGNTYYVVVTGNPSNAAAQCGSYTVAVAGTVPVELQSFSVE